MLAVSMALLVALVGAARETPKAPAPAAVAAAAAAAAAKAASMTARLVTADSMPRFAERLRKSTGKGEAGWAPEPCYPPPCPGFEYNKLMLSRDNEQANEDIGAVPAEHSLGDWPPEAGGGDSGMEPPPEMPQVQVLVPGDNGDDEESIVMLPPPPPFQFPISIGDEDEDNPSSHVQKQEFIHAREHARHIDHKIRWKERISEDHDRWIAKAQNTIDDINQMIVQAHESQQAINLQISRLKVRKQEVMRDAEKAKLEKGLQDAQTALMDLGDQQEVLKATKQIIESSREKVNSRLTGMAKKVGIHGTPEHVEAKIREWAASTDPVAKKLQDMWETYPEYPGVDKPATHNGKPPGGFLI